MTALTSLGDAFLLLGGPIGSSLAVISSTVYLRRFLHFQSSPSYRVAASVPEGFRSLPYPVVPKERQLIINVRLENIQRVAICATLTVAWGHFLYQRRSSRPVTQLDTTLWLYRLSLRGTMHLEFWLVNLGMALAEVTAVALCCGNIFHLPLISVCTLGSTIVWATLIAGITIQQFHFHRYYGIPIIGIGLATALTQIPAWAARCIFWCFPDLFHTNLRSSLMKLTSTQP
ncbi:hypothetical protein BJ085DRAFT_28042 [Dimargaris cristalligena]|uniref:Uncharacterized protein n=1 Tax=Dimargaris cristalligena TaxID=215637 RepID=A0A4P9ZU05_9FUNG|nr:hypothetical protein BJ085DRAFT_28042 [Dimargaris cristalligena]|eukprot:RKP36997.1 hypothetical protein BJ085DRAFT_28042 [Dimargaris cristalligena]